MSVSDLLASNSPASLPWSALSVKSLAAATVTAPIIKGGGIQSSSPILYSTAGLKSLDGMPNPYTATPAEVEGINYTYSTAAPLVINLPNAASVWADLTSKGFAPTFNQELTFTLFNASASTITIASPDASWDLTKVSPAAGAIPANTYWSVKLLYAGATSYCLY